MFYSPSTGGFYQLDTHGLNIPDDAVEITEEERAALLSDESQGKIIGSGATGHPVLIDPPVDTSPERYARDIAARRYQAETAGITVNGMALPTDRDSQALVTGTALVAVIDPGYYCQWKTSTGFIDVNAQQIIALASAMRAHIQVCFDREAELLAHLENGTYTEDLLDQGWPA